MYFGQGMYNPNMQEINRLYPEIYNIIYPMVQKCYSMRNITTLTENQVREMVDEIYEAIEAKETPQTRESNIQPKNGDVKNPRAKEPAKPNNYLLRDLIRILIINEFLNSRGMNHNPTMPGMNGFNPNMPPHMQPNMPPIMRPGNIGR